ncbi:MAG: ribosome recycling factor [Candidatus Abyssobacteria bacterium SURF_17]|uniref:Ribosome-recycling factor n=1 Tax=Candidatus Abyssobacteria bacterium SURF_17 TaxID=2093361 RepID=A0A419EX56_9BACT|nr:MAG: ribosome recycling factor [Candidatus Abyssubacteria bacterium SURF_17]
MRKEVLSSIRDQMNRTQEHIRREFSSIRTGRASTSLLDSIDVEYYGSSVSLNQIANVSVPEPRLLLVTPYDKGALGSIEKALLKSDLGLTPNNDGRVVRIPIPELTEERRKSLVKVVRRLAEDSRVALRNIRRDANDRIKKGEKNGDISEDESHRIMDEVQNVTNEYIEKVDELLKVKEAEIMEV